MTGPAPLRRRLVLPLLVVAFIVVSVAEVWLLTAVASRITVLATLAILIAEALVGVWLMRREGSKAWRALVDAYSTGRMPSGRLADAALVLVGGMMLILPGFFTDLIGLACLLPGIRPYTRRVLGSLMARQASKAGLDLGVLKARFQPDTVVRGETVPDQRPEPEQRVVRGEVEG